METKAEKALARRVYSPRGIKVNNFVRSMYKGKPVGWATPRR